ncbi:FecR domain-containing protein [Pendulispora rubella]|uniref:FecR domain-containing protein n=1 Tax=Pendulispora rubella TaxID=2741070 RepID=A0ABZ2L8L2_9BACT
MADLKTPLRKHLEDGFDEADVQRNWRGVQRRLVHQELRSKRSTWSMAFAAVAVVGVAVLVLWVSGVRWTSAGPLRLAAGPLPGELAASGAGQTVRTELSDGSRVTLAPNTHLEVLENSGDAFVTALRRGRSSFDVKPGGSRRWVIECGLATVEVVGTAFSIQRDGDKVDVVVERGIVSVRGELVPGRERRLTAGERIRVAATAEEEAVDAGAAEDGGGFEMKMTVRRFEPEPEPAHVDEHEHEHGQVNEHEQVAPVVDEVGGMLREADRAQKAGDKKRAAEVLHKVVREAHGDPRAAFAAFSLARLTMEDDPRAAAAALAAMLDAGVPRGLEEDVRARCVEAYARAGDPEKARAAAAEYERRFPEGTRGEEVRRWARP